MAFYRTTDTHCFIFSVLFIIFFLYLFNARPYEELISRRKRKKSTDYVPKGKTG